MKKLIATITLSLMASLLFAGSNSNVIANTGYLPMMTTGSGYTYSINSSGNEQSFAINVIKPNGTISGNVALSFPEGTASLVDTGWPAKNPDGTLCQNSFILLVESNSNSLKDILYFVKIDPDTMKYTLNKISEDALMISMSPTGRHDKAHAIIEDGYIVYQENNGNSNSNTLIFDYSKYCDSSTDVTAANSMQINHTMNYPMVRTGSGYTYIVSNYDDVNSFNILNPNGNLVGTKTFTFPSATPQIVYKGWIAKNADGTIMQNSLILLTQSKTDGSEPHSLWIVKIDPVTFDYTMTKFSEDSLMTKDAPGTYKNATAGNGWFSYPSTSQINNYYPANMVVYNYSSGAITHSSVGNTVYPLLESGSGNNYAVTYANYGSTHYDYIQIVSSKGIDGAQMMIKYPDGQRHIISGISELKNSSGSLCQNSFMIWTQGKPFQAWIVTVNPDKNTYNIAKISDDSEMSNYTTIATWYVGTGWASFGFTDQGIRSYIMNYSADVA